MSWVKQQTPEVYSQCKEILDFLTAKRKLTHVDLVKKSIIEGLFDLKMMESCKKGINKNAVVVHLSIIIPHQETFHKCSKAKMVGEIAEKNYLYGAERIFRDSFRGFNHIFQMDKEGWIIFKPSGFTKEKKCSPYRFAVRTLHKLISNDWKSATEIHRQFCRFFEGTEKARVNSFFALAMNELTKTKKIERDGKVSSGGRPPLGEEIYKYKVRRMRQGE